MNTDIAASWANLGLLRRPTAVFFVAVGGSLASLGLFNCLQDGRTRVAAAGRWTLQRHTWPACRCCAAVAPALVWQFSRLCFVYGTLLRLINSLSEEKPSKASRSSSVAWLLGKKMHQRVIMGKRLVLELHARHQTVPAVTLDWQHV